MDMIDPCLRQYVHGLPGGRNGFHRVEGPHGDVCHREAAAKGTKIDQVILVHTQSGFPNAIKTRRRLSGGWKRAYSQGFSSVVVF